MGLGGEYLGFGDEVLLWKDLIVTGGEECFLLIGVESCLSLCGGGGLGDVCTLGLEDTFQDTGEVFLFLVVGAISVDLLGGEASRLRMGEKLWTILSYFSLTVTMAEDDDLLDDEK